VFLTQEKNRIYYEIAKLNGKKKKSCANERRFCCIVSWSILKSDLNFNPCSNSPKKCFLELYKLFTTRKLLLTIKRGYEGRSCLNVDHIRCCSSVCDSAKINHRLESISSMFYSHFSYESLFGSFTLLRVWLWSNFHTKNACVKCWWNCPLVFRLIGKAVFHVRSCLDVDHLHQFSSVCGSAVNNRRFGSWWVYHIFRIFWHCPGVNFINILCAPFCSKANCASFSSYVSAL